MSVASDAPEAVRSASNVLHDTPPVTADVNGDEPEDEDTCGGVDDAGETDCWEAGKEVPGTGEDDFECLR